MENSPRLDGSWPRDTPAEALTRAVIAWAARWGRVVPAEARAELFARLAELELEDPRFAARPDVLAFTPSGLAHALDLVVELGDEKQAKRRLGLWRMRGEGPRYLKSGTGRSASVFYPVESVLDWLARAGEGFRQFADLRRAGDRPAKSSAIGSADERCDA